ncbi:MAG: ThiF family adenylyltransferase [Verrucomicrobia bacterium]|nr:ThiF family adenylyltransferase [Verrucomicrobiota bacterium]
MKPPVPEAPIRLHEGRFARLEAIEWWDQDLISRTRVLLVGAGALGNEILKNLALLGVGQVAVVDLDRVERSNLSRSVLYREADEGQPKAECAARAARQLYPGMRVIAKVGNVLAEVGLGYFRWADVVLGALDNREARVFVNSVCARVGRPWFDGGIEVLQGVVRGFAPPATACYECTMSAVDWELLNQRRSCSLLARRASGQRGVPTTPTTASVIGALQVQELVKHRHGLKSLLGQGYVFEGLEHASTRVDYPIAPDCVWHEPPAPIVALPARASGTPLRVLREEALRHLGQVEAFDFSREVVERLECTRCGRSAPVWRPAEAIQPDQLICPGCQSECAPVFRSSIAGESALLERTAAELGLPAWDILWARQGSARIGLELAGDNPFDEGTQTAPAPGQLV